MAILKYGIMGPVSNKVGTVIGRNFRGLNVITQLYKKSSKPSTINQKRSQARLGLLSSFLSRAQTLVEPGFIKTAKAAQSALNAAHSYNYPHAFIEENEEFKLNFSKIVLSRGPVERPNCATVAKEDHTLIFGWLPQAENKYSRYDDKASFLLYDGETKKMILLKYKAIRSDLKFEFEIPEPLRGCAFNCFMLFHSQNGKLVGNSEYVGFIPFLTISTPQSPLNLSINL